MQMWGMGRRWSCGSSAFGLLFARIPGRPFENRDAPSEDGMERRDDCPFLPFVFVLKRAEDVSFRNGLCVQLVEHGRQAKDFDLLVDVKEWWRIALSVRPCTKVFGRDTAFL